MKFNRKGSVDFTATPMKVVYAFLGIILLVLFAAELLPEVMTALTNISNIANLPLAGLFGSGVVLMIIVAVIIVAVIKGASKVAK